jgi:hypothetical protein
MLLVLFLAAGVAAWAAVRSDKAARAGVSPADQPSVTYGVNDEESAGRRWATGQTRHWRYLLVQH